VLIETLLHPEMDELRENPSRLGLPILLCSIAEKHPCCCVEIERTSFFEYLAINRKLPVRGVAASDHPDHFLLTSPVCSLGQVGKYKRPKKPNRLPTIFV
jgi:hypothetical protein